MNKEIRSLRYNIIFFMSVFLISTAIVSTIGVWQNKSFYFDGYIYNNYLSSARDIYCADLSRFISREMTDDEITTFQSQTYGVYYYVTDENTKEAFTNIPDEFDYMDFSSQPNIITLPYVKNSTVVINMADYYVKTPSGEEEDPFYGFIFIDKNAGELLASSFRYTIDTGFSQQKLLFAESVLFVVSLLLGSALFLISFKRAANNLTGFIDFIPLDIKIAAPVSVFIVEAFLMNAYLRTIRTFPMLRRRLILFAVLTALTFILLFLIVILILKIRQYYENKSELKQEWENRLTKNTPNWIIGLVLQFIWYFLILAAFSPSPYFNGYISMIGDNIFAVIFHTFIITMVFLLIRKIQKSKTLYIEEVLHVTKEIANGDFGKNVPVVGNDGYAQIAGAINTIKEGYIRALDEQKKSERLKYELVTNISHDLRTPLTSIINYIGLVRKKGISGETERYIGHAEANAKRLNVLIEDLFELSKMESGNMPLDITPVDIVLMLKQTGHEYGEIMKQNGIELILESSSKQIMWQCDALKIWRLFDNIINNAVKYSLPGTRIYVTITENTEDEKLVVSIKNIASYKMDFNAVELFLRFKRGDDARNTDGSGLGLAIAKSIVKLHNGDIHIETEGDMFKIIVQFQRNDLKY